MLRLRTVLTGHLLQWTWFRFHKCDSLNQPDPTARPQANFDPRIITVIKHVYDSVAMRPENSGHPEISWWSESIGHDPFFMENTFIWGNTSLVV